MDLKTSPEIKCGEMILKLDLGEPSERAKEKALHELRETVENRENGLKELKRLLKGEPDLNVPMTDEWLIKFLRCCKFYPESALDLLKRYCKIRSKYPEITTDLVPRKLKHVFDQNIVSIMPQRDQHGRRIIITLGGSKWDPKIVTDDDLFRSSTICTEAIYLEPETQINGVVFILDFDGLSFSQMLRLTPYRVLRLVDYLQGNIPARVKGIHIINQPRIFQAVYTVAKPLCTAKYSKRLIMHGSNYKSLHEHISPECLPKCYGGTLDIELTNGPETYQLTESFEKYFESMQAFGLKSYV